MPTKLEEAIDLMNQALEYDSHKDYEDALKTYEKGINYFLDALHLEVEGELAREAVVSKCQVYCARAEELRQRINERSGHAITPTAETAELKERHLPKAIEILTRARVEDAKSNARDALKLYQQGLHHFDIVLGCKYAIDYNLEMYYKHPVDSIPDEIYSEQFKAALQARRKVYEERVNILRERVHL